jgi:aspartate aminotransferase
MGLYAERCALIGSENAFKVGPYIREVEEQGRRVIKCNLGEPDFPLPEHIRDSVKDALDKDQTHYCDPQGILPLRQAIAKQISETRGLKITPDRVVVYPGAKPPIGFCQQTYVNPGEEVIYPSPGFPIYESFTRYIEAVPVPLHLQEEKGFSCDAQDVEQLISPRTKMIFLNFPSNPTGGTAKREQLEAIADVIKRKAPADVRVYSDEVYENILFDGERHFSIASVPGMEERTIIISGASKTYSWTGGRIGWAIFPNAEEANLQKNLNINYFSCTAAYNQLGVKTALESSQSGPAIKKMVSAFQERRDLVVPGLNAIPGIKCQNPKGAFYVFPNVSGVCKDLGAVDAYQALSPQLKQHTTPSTLLQMFLLFKYGVATMDRKSFGAIGCEGKHYLRLSIATGLEDLKQALKIIGQAVQDRARFKAFVSEGQHLY